MISHDKINLLQVYGKAIAVSKGKRVAKHSECGCSIFAGILVTFLRYYLKTSLYLPPFDTWMLVDTAAKFSYIEQQGKLISYSSI
jgi:hypothetical protein